MERFQRRRVGSLRSGRSAGARRWRQQCCQGAPMECGNVPTGHSSCPCPHGVEPLVGNLPSCEAVAVGLPIGVQHPTDAIRDLPALGGVTRSPRDTRNMTRTPCTDAGFLSVCQIDRSGSDSPNVLSRSRHTRSRSAADRGTRSTRNWTSTAGWAAATSAICAIGWSGYAIAVWSGRDSTRGTMYRRTTVPPSSTGTLSDTSTLPSGSQGWMLFSDQILSAARLTLRASTRSTEIPHTNPSPSWATSAEPPADQRCAGCQLGATATTKNPPPDHPSAARGPVPHHPAADHHPARAPPQTPPDPPDPSHAHDPCHQGRPNGPAAISALPTPQHPRRPLPPEPPTPPPDSPRRGEPTTTSPPAAREMERDHPLPVWVPLFFRSHPRLSRKHQRYSTQHSRLVGGLHLGYRDPVIVGRCESHREIYYMWSEVGSVPFGWCWSIGGSAAGDWAAICWIAAKFGCLSGALR